MSDKNTTHLAGEFLVAGELSRRGYPVSITMGNAKAVDIKADAKDAERSISFSVDAKAGRTKTNWPIKKSAVEKDLYFVFVYLQTDYKEAPEYFVVPGKDILCKNLVTKWNTREGVKYRALKEGGYEGKWETLPDPPSQEDRTQGGG